MQMKRKIEMFDPEIEALLGPRGNCLPERVWLSRAEKRFPEEWMPEEVFLDHLIAELTTHEIVTNKFKAPCWAPAVFTDNRRLNRCAKEVHLVALDSDKGTPRTEIENAIRDAGYWAVIVSSHSHLTTVTEFKKEKWKAWCERNPGKDAAAFMKSQGYRDEVVSDAEMIANPDGPEVRILHNPCPKFRIVMVAQRPWRASNYDNHTEATRAYTAGLKNLAAELELMIDPQATDAARYFFMSSCPPGAKTEAVVIEGLPVDPWDPSRTAPKEAVPRGEIEFNAAKGQQATDLSQVDFEAAVMAIKNDDAFAGNGWASIAGAIKTEFRLKDWPYEEGLELFDRWASTYEENGGDPHDPVRAEYLYRTLIPTADGRHVLKKALENGWRRPQVDPDEEFTEEDVEGVPVGGSSARAKKQVPLEWACDVEPVLFESYLIKNILPDDTMSVVYGPSNSGKTFFALDMAYHIALGRPWNGRRVREAAVLYLAAEGGRGLLNRVVAFKREYGPARALAIRRAPLDLLKPTGDVKEIVSLAQEVKTKTECSGLLILVDTLSRAIAGGDENSPVDMTAFIANVDAIRAETGAHVMVIHHSGKDIAKGARGHSSLRAATDTEIELRENGGMRVANVAKQRDLAGGENFTFSLRRVDLGTDQDGDTVTSCVVVFEAAPYSTVNLTKQPLTALNILNDLAASGKPVTKGEWQRACVASGKVSAAKDEESQASSVRRAIKQLLEKNIVELRGDVVRRKEEPDAGFDDDDLEK